MPIPGSTRHARKANLWPSGRHTACSWAAVPLDVTTAPARLRVLVAEDDAEMRRLVVDGLRKDGYEIEEESDGGRALLRLLSVTAPFDLIVSDVRMPGCSGLDVVNALREAGSHTPVILMTAFGDDETRARAQGLGAVFVDKPLALGYLRLVARRVLAQGLPIGG